MAQDFMVALEAEIAGLETELSADVRFVRLQQLRKTLALYVDPDAVAAEMRALSARVISPGMMQSGHQGLPDRRHVVVRTHGRRPAIDKTAALEAVALHLANRSGPVPTRELLEHLMDLGIEVGGVSPLNNLSAMLSNSDRFESHGRLGWTVAPFQKVIHSPQEAFKDASMLFLFENSASRIEEIVNHMEFNKELPDDVKDDLSKFYEGIMGEKYIPGKPGGFQEVFINELEEFMKQSDNN